VVLTVFIVPCAYYLVYRRLEANAKNPAAVVGEIAPAA
jgi:hypothetical protein